MNIIKTILLAVVGYALYETVNHFLGEFSKTSKQHQHDEKRRVTGHGDGMRSHTDGAHGQSTSTVVGRGVVSKN